MDKKVAQVQWNPVNTRWEASYKGKVLVKGADLPYVVNAIRQGKNPKCKSLGITDVVGFKDGAECDISVFMPPVGGTRNKAAKEMEQAKYLESLTSVPIDDRIKFGRRIIQMVLTGVSHACIISGPGGLGKSYIVQEEIDKADLKPASFMTNDGAGGGQAGVITAEDGELDEESLESKVFDASEVGGDYMIIKGYSTAHALYRTLFKYRFKTIVFDDCDSIQKDDVAINLLKACLDSGKDRWVAWNASPIGGSDVPPMFQFHGRVIFISNMPVDKIDQALRTRAYMLDFSMTPAQKMQYMKSALKQVLLDHPEWEYDKKGGDPMLYINESFEFLDGIKDEVKELNFRTLLGIIKIRVHNKQEWKDLAEYMAKYGFR